MRKTAVHDRLAEALRKAREDAGISQRDLAARLGTNQTAVSFIENGTQGVRVSEMVDWCLVLGVDPVHLLRAVVGEQEG